MKNNDLEITNHHLFQAKEVLTFSLAYLDAVVAQATETTFALDKYNLRTRLEMIRTTFLMQLEKTEKKLGSIDPNLAEQFQEVINKKREIVDKSKNKVINKNREIVDKSKIKEAKETNKDKEKIPPTPPIREKENKKEKEEIRGSGGSSRACARVGEDESLPEVWLTIDPTPRARVGEIALRTPSRCTATWHPTLEEVTIWADYHIFKGREEAEWIKWWYGQMEEVLEWRNAKDDRFINWKATLQAWWKKTLQNRKFAEVDKLRAETAKLNNEKAKQRQDFQKHADNYLPHNKHQKRGFYDR